jgi:hypothetical protein
MSTKLAAVHGYCVVRAYYWKRRRKVYIEEEFVSVLQCRVQLSKQVPFRPAHGKHSFYRPYGMHKPLRSACQTAAFYLLLSSRHWHMHGWELYRFTAVIHFLPHVADASLLFLCRGRKPAISMLCVSTSFSGRWQETAVFHTDTRMTFIENVSCAMLQPTALSFICRWHTTPNRVGKASRRSVGGTVPNMVNYYSMPDLSNPIL